MAVKQAARNENSTVTNTEHPGGGGGPKRSRPSDPKVEELRRAAAAEFGIGRATTAVPGALAPAPTKKPSRRRGRARKGGAEAVGAAADPVAVAAAVKGGRTVAAAASSQLAVWGAPNASADPTTAKGSSRRRGRNRKGGAGAAAEAAPRELSNAAAENGPLLVPASSSSTSSSSSSSSEWDEELTAEEHKSCVAAAAVWLVGTFGDLLDDEVATYIGQMVVDMATGDDDDDSQNCGLVLESYVGDFAGVDDDPSEPIAAVTAHLEQHLAADRSSRRADLARKTAVLCEVFPQVHQAVVRDYLARHGSIDEAADQLHRTTEALLRAEEESERRSAELARQAAFFKVELTDEDREKIAVSYGIFRNVPKDGCHRPVINTKAGGKGERKTQHRFRDSKVVSTRGERHLVEPKEDADFVRSTSVNLATIIGGGRTH